MNDRISLYLKAINAERDSQYKKACLHAPMIYIAEEMVRIWSEAYVPFSDDNNVPCRNADITVAFSSPSIDCVAVNLHLLPTDSLKGGLVEQILNIALYNEDLAPAGQSDYEALEWRAWNFKLKSAMGNPYPYNNVKLMVRFWYGESKSCRQVDSGETKPVMKVVCE